MHHEIATMETAAPSSLVISDTKASKKLLIARMTDLNQNKRGIATCLNPGFYYFVTNVHSNSDPNWLNYRDVRRASYCKYEPVVLDTCLRNCQEHSGAPTTFKPLRPICTGCKALYMLTVPHGVVDITTNGPHAQEQLQMIAPMSDFPENVKLLMQCDKNIIDTIHGQLYIIPKEMMNIQEKLQLCVAPISTLTIEQLHSMSLDDYVQFYATSYINDQPYYQDYFEKRAYNMALQKASEERNYDQEADMDIIDNPTSFLSAIQ